MNNIVLLIGKVGVGPVREISVVSARYTVRYSRMCSKYTVRYSRMCNSL